MLLDNSPTAMANKNTKSKKKLIFKSFDGTQKNN